MRPCGLVSGDAWEVCLVVWVRVELYALPGHSSRCNRKETETDAQGAASATSRKKHKQRQKWMNNSNKETAIRILTRLNTLIALERKERRIRYGVHLLYSRSATSKVKNNSLHDSAGSTTFLPCLPEHVVTWRSVFDYTSPVREWGRNRVFIHGAAQETCSATPIWAEYMGFLTKTVPHASKQQALQITPTYSPGTWRKTLSTFSNVQQRLHCIIVYHSRLTAALVLYITVYHGVSQYRLPIADIWMTGRYVANSLRSLWCPRNCRTISNDT